MTTNLKERFMEKFSDSKHYYYFARASTGDEVLAFIKQELELLVEEVEKGKCKDEYFYDEFLEGVTQGIENAAAIIKNSIKEL